MYLAAYWGVEITSSPLKPHPVSISSVTCNVTMEIVQTAHELFFSMVPELIQNKNK